VIVNDLFDIVFFFAMNQLRGWLTILFFVSFCFMMRNQKINVKHIMHLEGFREFDAISDWRDLL
jgi:hypothetical protein